MTFFKNLFASETVPFKELINKGAVIIDVRSPTEYASGHIKGSLNIPVDAIQVKIEDIKRRGKVFITVCRSGARSSMAQKMLSSAGLEAYNGGPWTSLEKQIS